MEIILTAVAVLFLVCLSGFFSGSETALTAISRARLNAAAQGGEARATLVESLIERRDRLIGALLIGNNLVNILSSALATALFLRLFGESGVVWATLVMTALLVVFAEVLPKSWAISNTDAFAFAVSRPIAAFVRVVGPLSSVVNALVRRILGVFGVDLAEGSLLSGREELRGAVDVLHREGGVEKDDRDRVGGVLDLHDLEVSDVMVHRTDMRSLDVDAPPAAIVCQVLDSPYTRMPLWRGEPENIVGVIHAKDLLRALDAAGNDPAAVDMSRITSKPWFVPDTTRLPDQLNAFLKAKEHLAIVVDEYGEVEGLVTLEDILEEIVGEIADEHDIDMSGVRAEADGSVVVDGSVPIRDLNRALDWTLPDEEATTVAGLVIHETKSIPDERQTFTYFDKRFTVMKRERNRITKLRIRDAA